MAQRDLIVAAIAAGITDANQQLEANTQLRHDNEQLLAGEGSPLDSLGLLLFVTAVESRLKPTMPTVNLVDLLMSSEHEADFKTVGALTRYLCSQA